MEFSSQRTKGRWTNVFVRVVSRQSRRVTNRLRGKVVDDVDDVFAFVVDGGAADFVVVGVKCLGSKPKIKVVAVSLKSCSLF